MKYVYVYTLDELLTINKDKIKITSEKNVVYLLSENGIDMTIHIDNLGTIIEFIIENENSISCYSENFGLFYFPKWAVKKL